ncbi:hypothetical protein SETIT_3G057900v2 [Setaria italica]|uniref:Uncharacterized protein n=1 Tax=Setaria italica TaxID=4555 RepID=A0A368QBZ2_SETIT|nr:hypothetical protein SETIT_3G057900v2 [Setaria italica]
MKRGVVRAPSFRLRHTSVATLGSGATRRRRPSRSSKVKTNYNYNLEQNGGVNPLIPVNAELRVSDSAAVCLSAWDDPTPCSLHRRNHAGELSRFEIRSISRFMRRRREEIRDSALAPTTSGYQAGRLMRMPGQTELVPVHGTSCKCRGCQDRRSAAPGNELISLS